MRTTAVVWSQTASQYARLLWFGSVALRDWKGTAVAGLLVIGHSKTATLRRLGDWFAQDGLDADVVFGGDGLPDDLRGYSGMMVLGGAPLPYQDDAYPWLPATRALTREAIDKDLPYLGICLGGQLLAYTAGGRVERRVYQPERGMTELSVLSVAAEDPLFSVLPQRFWMAENHQDHITALPEGAVCLAHSERTPVQGFRIGTCQWGLQFHPEVAAENIRQWDAESQAECAADGFAWPDVLATAEQHDQENTAVARRFADRFARLVLDKA